MHYTYDDLGQLIEERPGFGGYIYNYTYDNAGNITKIQVSSTNSVMYPATYIKNYYHTKNTENKMNNQISGISPTNPKVIIYFQAALKYFENQVSNEFLNWAGK